ncbi:uncharacterized protein METZ01_LOCUS34900, partial [marine metagenome]
VGQKMVFVFFKIPDTKPAELKLFIC